MTETGKTYADTADAIDAAGTFAQRATAIREQIRDLADDLRFAEPAERAQRPEELDAAGWRALTGILATLIGPDAGGTGSDNVPGSLCGLAEALAERARDVLPKAEAIGAEHRLDVALRDGLASAFRALHPLLAELAE